MSSNDKWPPDADEPKDGDGGSGGGSSVPASGRRRADIEPEGLEPDPNPGDGPRFHDRGDVAMDVAADREEGSSVPLSETEAAPEAQSDDPGAETAPEAAMTAAASTAPPKEGAPGTEGAPDLSSAPEPEAARQAPPPPPPSSPQKARGGFWPALFGGALAAGIGFAAAYFLNPDILTPEPEGPDPLQQALAAQDERLSGLDARIGEIAEAVQSPQTGGLEERLEGVAGNLETLSADLSQTLDTLAGRLDDLSGDIETVGSGLGSVQEGLSAVDARLGTVDERLTAVEKRPLTESSEAAQQAFDAYERELEQLRANLAEQEQRNAEISDQLSQAAQEAEARLAEASQSAEQRIAEVQTQATSIREEALTTAQEAALREAVVRIGAALDRGTPYANALAALPDEVSAPEDLAEYAESGVPSLQQLRASLPDAAREALDASIRETVADDPAGRVVAFLRSQTGARSLAPREGDDPDAILSRAEAAVAEGDLQTALQEVESLPDSGQQALADWVSRAQARLEATAALEALSAELDGE